MMRLTMHCAADLLGGFFVAREPHHLAVVVPVVVIFPRLLGSYSYLNNNW